MGDMNTNVRISANGRICIPADVRERLGLKDGDTLSLAVTDDALVLRTVQQRVRGAQAIVRGVLGNPKGSVVDEFLAERRHAWEREEEKWRTNG